MSQAPPAKVNSPFKDAIAVPFPGTSQKPSSAPVKA